MALFLKLLFAIPIITAVYFLLALTLPSKFIFQQSIQIEGEKTQIFPFLNNLKNWQYWVNWLNEDDERVKFSYSDYYEGQGSTMFWTHKSTGKGSVTIDKSDLADGINYTNVLDGTHFDNKGKISLYHSMGITRVTWKIHGNVGRHLSARYFVFLFRRSVRKEMYKSLAILKTEVERSA